MQTKLLGELFDYEVLLDYEPEEIKFSNVTFKQDFGPWKKGQHVDILWVDFELGQFKEIKIQRGFLVAATATEVEIQTCRFKLTPLCG